MTPPTREEVEASAAWLILPPMARQNASCEEIERHGKTVAEGFRALLASQPQWQPIESAPRDGTVILARDNRGEAAAIQYRPLHKMWTHFTLAPGTLSEWMPIPQPTTPNKEKT